MGGDGFRAVRLILLPHNEEKMRWHESVGPDL